MEGGEFKEIQNNDLLFWIFLFGSSVGQIRPTGDLSENGVEGGSGGTRDEYDPTMLWQGKEGCRLTCIVAN